MNTKITEIIPDDIPDWAKVAMHDGQFFCVALDKIEKLTELNRELCRDLDEVQRAYEQSEVDKTELQLRLSQTQEALRGVTRLAEERGIMSRCN